MTQSRQLPGQPLTVFSTGFAALVVLAVTWGAGGPHLKELDDGRTWILVLCLSASLILSYHFPIHVDRSSKVYMGSIVLYLMATLLYPALAATTIGLGIFVGELSACHRTGNHRFLSIIPTQAARWTVVGLLGSLVAHMPENQQAVSLVAAAITMWTGDILTGPLLLSPVLGHSPRRIINMMVREGGAFEGAQYLIGVLGALEAKSQIWTLVLLVLPAALIYLSFKRAAESSDQTRRILEDLADTVDLRDLYGHNHSRRVAGLAREILQQLGKRGPGYETIILAAQLHDIGKITVPEEILRKPAQLTDAEWTIMKTHAERGADILARYADFAPCASLVHHHHESWDGAGYPDGLSGVDIPLGSRIIAVAESYDAMTNDCPYRPRLAPEDASEILRNGRNRQWDSEVVDALLAAIKLPAESPRGPRLQLVSNIEVEGPSC